MKQVLSIVFFLAVSVQVLAQADVQELYNQALALKKERKCTEAIPVLLKVTELRPNYAKALADLGWCYNETKQFDKAIPQLQKALLADSTDAIAYSEIGYSYYSIQQYATAIGHLNNANYLKPRTETTIYYLGLCFVRLNSKTEAVKRYNELSLMNSSYAGKLLEEIKLMK
ncbi:MAG TPA: tetratricopeptide repeat protein [Lacibacter sp.]|nr:tetratricopeptide repeat protein [Lacibacter sp.]